MMNKSVLHIPNFLVEKEFKDLISLIEDFTKNPSFPGWKLNGFSDPENSEKIFWNISLNDNEYFSEILFKKVKQTIFDISGENVDLTRVYLNGATFGQQGYYHTDSDFDNERTFLVYCNDSWKEEWAGATVFKSDQHIHTIFPIPGSAVYFNADIPHFSQPIGRDFYGLRVTLAYKLILQE